VPEIWALFSEGQESGGQGRFRSTRNRTVCRDGLRGRHHGQRGLGWQRDIVVYFCISILSPVLGRASRHKKHAIAPLSVPSIYRSYQSPLPLLWLIDVNRSPVIRSHIYCRTSNQFTDMTTGVALAGVLRSCWRRAKGTENGAVRDAGGLRPIGSID
jgi:hypothetical protein